MDEDFAAMFRRHGPAIHAYLARLTGDPVLAEDLCQETFVRYLRHEEALRGRNGHVAPWLFRVASNLGIDRLRRRRLRPLDETRLDDRGDGDPARRGDEAEALRVAVEALEPGLRAAFLLHAHHGLTYAQLGAVLGLTERGAKDRYRRARDELAVRLAAWIEEDRS